MSKIPDRELSNFDINRYGYPAMSSDAYMSSGYDKAVLNLDNKGSGTHWVAIDRKGPNEYDYYDSFGIRPSYNTVTNSIVWYNTHQDQKMGETNCGKRSIEWLNHTK